MAYILGTEGRSYSNNWVTSVTNWSGDPTRETTH